MRERILLAIADPNIALLLLVLGALGIYVEFSSPGLVAPGVIGAVLVLLGLTALSVFPIDWLGAGADGARAGLFHCSKRNSRRTAFLRWAARWRMVFGALMLIDTNAPEMRIHLSTALGITIPFALITSFLFSIAWRARQNKVTTGMEGMMGQSAVAVDELNPAGLVLVRGEYWKALASARVAASEPVRITGVEGLTLRVEPMSSAKETS